jgi:uncharacterized protein YhjY with autotransporter beta-barrel domain
MAPINIGGTRPSASNTRATFTRRQLVTALHYALWGASLIPVAAMAQSVPAGNTQPVNYTNAGAAGADQNTIGLPGGDGSAGPTTTVDLQTLQTIKTGSVQSLVNVGSTGGKGGYGGLSDAGYGPSGPQGGTGGQGGAVTVTLHAPLDSGPYSVLENSAPNGYGVSAFSQGGQGGDGQQNIADGNGGVGGTGGDGGKVEFDMPLNPNQPSELSYIQATGTAVNLYSIGGDGGASGQSQGGYGKKITGRKGGAAGAGGEIDANVAGNINGYAGGSGIVALSQGGDGGMGGDASGSIIALATGSDGGDAGKGGAVNVTVTGGTVTAQGPDKAATGPQQTFDSATDTTQTVPLDTSVTAGAILAISQGGVGGDAGTVDGTATHGGNGAQGGQGGIVTVKLGGSSLGALNNNAVISTTGYNTFGVMALSAGGNGGDSTSGGGVYFRKGGKGGTGGAGVTANVMVGNDTSTPYAKVITAGDDSDALVALSVGGGGGYGGDLNQDSGGGVFSVYIGGEGGNGGNGGPAYVGNGYYDNPPPTDGSQAAFHPGDVIITTGTYSRGLVAQSVGGGGGRGGDVTNASLGSSVTIGGTGGTGATGGLAQTVNYGLISTSGQHSAGMFSQSVGGGGGSGGGALSTTVGAQISVAVAVGGNGGVGGSAGEADAYNIGQVQTLGGNAHGIFAQSVGGGGGFGGTAAAQNYNTSIPDEPSISLTTSIGGRGGVGGDGGAINVVNAGLLQTQGQDAYGVFAQSVGGGGGAGGDASATSMAYQQAKLTVATAIGGSGSGGGIGGNVKVVNSGLISTAADEGIGIFAQSVGGGGGAGGVGTTDQGGLYQGGDYSTQLSVAIGGQGGKAAKGGNVLVTNYISADPNDPGHYADFNMLSNRDLTGAGGILTQGDMAAGIFAQSVGGGGGNGGDATGKGSNGQLNLNVAIGGGGGAGGDGGTVEVHNGNGAIQTYGAQSYGIFGQSVGGGGGTGGNAVTGSGDDPEYQYPKLAVTLAAKGYGKDPSGFTKVTDDIWDWKDNVKGAWDDANMLNNLYDTTHELYTPTKPMYSGLTAANLTVDVGGGAGGKGGSGGDGNTVTIDSNGSIQTHGSMAYGMFGQSVGGGGGVGGGAAPVTANDKLHDSAIESSIAVGGSGGGGGNGDTVTLINLANGDIQTSGDLAFGMFSQSVGGGGGVGGASTPNAGLGNPMALRFGASGNGISGHGGFANAINDGAIQTFGDNAIGMVAQSVGGGGGLVGVMGQDPDQDTGLYHSTTQTIAGNVVTPTLGVNENSSKNNGGNVYVQLSSGGTITTHGINAFGVLAQSVGGGGGLMVIGPDSPITVDQLAPKLSSSDTSDSNNAGLVMVTTQPQTSITTSGDGAAGIVAQSLGGSGVMVNGLDGVNLDTTSSQVTASRWVLGEGGAVTVNSSSDIHTTGAYAHGIFAQVASGTGGVIGRSDGTGVLFHGVGLVDGGLGTECNVSDCGDVAVNLQAGTVQVQGQHSWGVFLDSENAIANGTSYENNVELSVGSQARVLATGQSDGAVLLNGSGQDVVQNAGVIDGSSSAGGYAIKSVNRSFKVTNESGGVISGSFGSKCSGSCNDVGDAVSSIDNAGVINTGDVVDLGGGTLSNTGTVSVHGGSLGTTTLTGQYTGAGQLVFDADYAGGKADKLVVDGSANVAGSVTVRPTTMRNATVPVMTATDGLTVDPLLTATTSELFSTRLDHDANTLYATPQARFSEQAAGLGATSRAVADHLQTLFDSGVPMDAGFTSLSKIGSQASYEAALRGMSGRSLGSVAAFRFQSSRDFVSTLDQGCDQDASRQADCTWGRVQSSSSRQDETADALGYRSNTQSYEMGVQRELRDGLTLGAAVGYENSQLRDADGTGSANGHSLLAGVGLRYNLGAFAFSGVLDAASGSYDSNRTVVVGDDVGHANAKPDVWNAGLHFQASYTHDFGAAYVMPFAELRGIQVHGGGYTEQGDSPFTLKVQGQSQFAVGGGLGAQVGTTFALDDGARLRLYLTGAVESGDGNDWRTRAQFAGQASGDTFDEHTQVAGTYGRLGVGANLLNWKNVDVSVSYDLGFGSGYHSSAGLARVDWRF